tara:strand:+ start:674 stop:874 length:201 start_codon:yes stop_codon:yes gene_type:complete
LGVIPTVSKVFQLLIEGRTQKEVSEFLDITDRTVRIIVSKLLREDLIEERRSLIDGRCKQYMEVMK